MRAFLVGLLSLLISATAWANGSGEVESIGFAGAYRPDCWTPMVVRIKGGSLKTDFYQIQVRQTDMDGDHVTYAKTISVTGGEESGGQDQRFWMYFIPQAQGLPSVDRFGEASAMGASVRDLQKELKIVLTTKGGKELFSLPVTSQLTNLEPTGGTFAGNRRGCRLVLFVSDGNSIPAINEFVNARDLLGVLEDTAFVVLKPSDLPENPIAYQAVDAIVWGNVDPSTLKAGDDSKYRALEMWIRNGGHFIISTPADWQKISDFGDLLPVSMAGVENANELTPLKYLAHDPKYLQDVNRQLPVNDPWQQVRPPYRMVRAAALPGSVVEEWIDWRMDGTDKSPWMVRKSVGSGCVTWIAQDLGDKTITSFVKTGWVHVWNRVLGTVDEPVVLTNRTAAAVKNRWAPGGAVDVGQALMEGLDLTSTSSLLVSIAILFFIVYWLIAGPGSFVYLASKKRAQASWFVFGLCAIGATALTVVIVKLVLRGPPKMQHVSYVRAVQGEPALVKSRLGLYIPRDGNQTITLPQASGALSEITPMPLSRRGDDNPVESTVAVDYTVPVRDLASEDSPTVTIPYRSTSKKIEVDWTGEMPGRIQGQASLVDPKQFLAGKLTNGTGGDLRHVYLAFHYPGAGANGGDHMVYFPRWDKDVTLDLGKMVVRNEKSEIVPLVSAEQDSNPQRGKHVRGRLDRDWQPYWYPGIRRLGNISGYGTFNDFSRDGEMPPQFFPILSLFGRLAPMDNEPNKNDRVEIVRRSGRILDVSTALAGGSLVVLAQTQGPLPASVEVEGDPLNGDGPTFYQFILPLDRTAAEKWVEEEEKG